MNEVEFRCVIDDTVSGECFSAEVTVCRCDPPTASTRDPGEFEFAHIYIVGLTDRPGLRRVSFTQNPAGEVVSTPDDQFDSFHSHFILFDLNGRGKYLRRNAFKRNLDKQPKYCSTFRLGEAFGRGVADAMRQMGESRV